jgi:hypothetical protein
MKPFLIGDFCSRFSLIGPVHEISVRAIKLLNWLGQQEILQPGELDYQEVMALADSGAARYGPAPISACYLGRLRRGSKLKNALVIKTAGLKIVPVEL